MIFYKTSGTPTAFNGQAVSGGTVGSGGTFNNSTPNPMQLGPLPTGSVYKSGNNVLYFKGLTQVQDPTARLLPSNLQSQNPLFAQGPSGNILIEHPPPGVLGSLSPTSFRGLGSFTLNLDISKPVVLNHEHNIVMILGADATNLLNKPIWATPSLNIDNTTFGQITSANGNRNVNLTLRVTF